MVMRLGLTQSITSTGSGGGGSVEEVELITLIGSNDGGKVNLIGWPNRLSNYIDPTSFPLTNASIVDNVAYTSDTNTPYSSLTETTANGNHIMQRSQLIPTSATAYTLTRRFKPGLRSRVVMSVNGAVGGVRCVYDLTTPQIGVAIAAFGGTSMVAGSASIGTADADGFVLCSMGFTSDTGGIVAIQCQGDNGSGTAALSNSYTGDSSSPAFWVYDLSMITGTSNGNVLTNLTDGNRDTRWDASNDKSWAGFDAGQTVTFTGYSYATANGRLYSEINSSKPYQAIWDLVDYPQGRVAEVGADQTFATAGTRVDVISNTQKYMRYNYNRHNFTASGRAFRLRQSNGALSGLKAFCQLQDGFTACKPVTPVINPWGGKFPAGTTSVVITSTTTSAKIYYTTDGTTPDNTKTLYAGPISLTSFGSSSVTLKAIAYNSTLDTAYSDVATAIFQGYAFKPNDDWYDTSGTLIEAHQGYLLLSAGTYYWFGYPANVLTQPTTATLTTHGRTNAGIVCYTSTDLMNWTNQGIVVPYALNSAGNPWRIFKNPNVIWNAPTSKWVMWCEVENDDRSTRQAVIFTSPALLGPWTQVSTGYEPGGDGYGDQSLFLDDDGNGYLLWVREANDLTRIGRLNSSFTAVASSSTLTSGAREAPVMFKLNGVYFVTYSSLFPVDGNPASGPLLYYKSNNTSDPMSGWSSENNLTGSGGGPGTIYGCQIFAFFKPPGKTYGFVSADRWWNSTNLYASRMTWLKLDNPTSTSIQTVNTPVWDLSALN